MTTSRMDKTVDSKNIQMAPDGLETFPQYPWKLNIAPEILPSQEGK